jgi:hypothetical protein
LCAPKKENTGEKRVPRIPPFFSSLGLAVGARADVISSASTSAKSRQRRDESSVLVDGAAAA